MWHERFKANIPRFPAIMPNTATGMSKPETNAALQRVALHVFHLRCYELAANEKGNTRTA